MDCEKSERNHTRQREISVLRMTPEGVWIFKNGELICNRTDHKKRYSFSNENMVKQYLEEVCPNLVTVPAGYLSACLPEVKKILTSDQALYVPITDYSMYLWFCNMTRNERKGKHVAMIEYYDHCLYVSGYVVDAAGESYQRRFCKLKIKYNRERNNIIKDILSQEIFNGKERGDNCIFRTFRAGAHIIICDLADWTKKAQKGGA